MIFKDGKTYDILKFIATRIGPIVVFLSAIVNIWNIPYGAQINATLAALEALVAALVAVSKDKFNKMVETGNDAGQGEEPDPETLPEQK